MSLRAATTCGAALIVLAGCTSTDDPSSFVPPDQSPAAIALTGCPEQSATPANQPAPPPLAFPCSTDGTLDLGLAVGIPTVVNVWASWCQPCRAELPLVGQLSANAGNELSVIGVVTSDVEENAIDFADASDAVFLAGLDRDGELLRELGMVGPPLTLFLRADGSLAHTESGPVSDEEELEALVLEHLGVALD